ncbi:hypothetical protein BKA59DRAFT_455584 [Fusarium tricinctum]|uniref:Rhodopsin domain-containing protein n=1 Tax=Fusarium tricinctum TaxID=61284 RepID=A0A8K0WCZ0_9HYPO|nr:hypothetical protein BKA59DRAFT_455584 [Fusarium tricinctum]
MDFTPNLAEIWTLYAVGTIMIGARVFVRTKLVGIQGYRADDYLVWLTWMVYTNVCVIAHVFIVKAQGKHTSLLTSEQRRTMPLKEQELWIYGSKIFLVGFYSYAAIVWSLKVNMLFFYKRVVRGLWVEKFVQPAMGFVLASAVAVILTFTLTCRPFHKLWQVYPDPGWLCEPQNKATFYTVLVLNIATDLCILLIPIPVVLSMQASIVRKLGLILLFSLGIFCILAAILRVVLIFAVNQQGVSAMWSMREDFVAIFVGQAPMVYPILRRQFWQGNYGDVTGLSDGKRSGGYEHHQMSVFSSRKPRDPYSITQIGATVIDKSENQEEIIKEPGARASPNKDQGRNGIMIKQTYDVEYEDNTHHGRRD